MNNLLLEKVCAEIRETLGDGRFGKIFVLSKRSLAIDFRSADGRFLFVSVDPASPRIYLIRRRVRDLEKASANAPSLALVLRKKLSGSRIERIEKLADDRVLIFGLTGRDDFGANTRHRLVVQLTGKSSNVFLLDENDAILDRLRETSGAGQEIGSLYSPPTRPPSTATQTASRNDVPEIGDRSLSEFLDEHFLNLESEREFAELAARARRKAADESKRLAKLLSALERDLETHGDADAWKMKGDLILANLADAVVVDGKLLVVDYFDESTPTIEIEIDENDSLTESAEKFFRRYAKARNAKKELSRRIEETRLRIAESAETASAIGTAVNDRDDAVLHEYVGGKSVAKHGRSGEKRRDSFSGARRFRSSDGYEILVGKASKDNDVLTFKVAKSLDTWLHAADYPGSHVIIRNQSRSEIPPKTLLEAAQLAAFYSHARQHPKAAVHYTLRKFVNKPKGAVAGLVSLASFKTILVEPGVNVEKIEA